MNDKDKEAFDIFYNKDFGFQNPRDAAIEAWQAACEYKQKEIDKLQAENEKLKECLKFTVKAAEYLFKPDEKLAEGLFPTSYFTLSYEGDLKLIEKTKRARQVLKELDSN